MSFPAYPSYRDSGVEWIGPVPADWDVCPLLAIADECDRSNRGMIEDNLLSLSYGSIVRRDINTSDGLLPESFETYQIIEPNDIVWRLTDLQNDKRSLRTAIVRERGIITSAYLATKPHGVLPTFLSYLLRAYDQEKVFYSMGGGLRQSMKYADVRRMPIVVPSQSEQIAIAAFLDRETAKIDALVEEQRRLIELLKEKRQAVISHAVIKGLDPTVPLKDSGVEWLGQVPAHWEVVPLKREVACLSGFAFPSADFSESPEDTPLLRGVNVAVGRTRWEDVVYWRRQHQDGLDGFELRAGDVVLGMDRPWIGDGLRVAQIVETDLPCLLLQRVAALRTSRDLLPPYLVHLLRSEAFHHHCVPDMTGVSVPHISPVQIGAFVVAVPPVKEQQHILQKLASIIAGIEQLVAAAEAAVSYLEERRAALISAAVTGKINVRALAKVLPFSIDRARARGLIGTEIIERLAQLPTFGRVKLQKIGFLAEAHVGVRELAGSYTREAAGPLDRTMIDEMEIGAHTIAGVTIDQSGGTGTAVSYKLNRQRGSSREELANWLGTARTAKLDKLIADFADLTTKGSEAVATLYGVWNDALIAGCSPTDDDIIAEFFNNWHPEKRQKFRADELNDWLEWMRRHGIVPSGSGPKTTGNSLFS